MGALHRSISSGDCDGAGGGAAAGAAFPASLPLAGISRTTQLADGDAGTEQTVNLIRQVVWDGLRDPMVRAQCAEILATVPAHNKRAEAEAIFNWIAANIRFTDHAVGHQMVQSAKWTLTWRIGNCTDINAVLMATMLEMVGIPVRLVTVANNPEVPDAFTHVYCEAQIGPAEWVPVDAARPNPTFGTTVQNIYRRRVWDLVSSEYRDVPVLAGVYRGGMGFDWGIFGNVVSSAGNTLSTIFRPAPSLSTVPYGPPAVPGVTYFPQSGDGDSSTLLIVAGLGLAMFAMTAAAKK